MVGVLVIVGVLVMVGVGVKVGWPHASSWKISVRLGLRLAMLHEYCVIVLTLPVPSCTPTVAPRPLFVSTLPYTRSNLFWFSYRRTAKPTSPPHTPKLYRQA